MAYRYQVKEMWKGLKETWFNYRLSTRSSRQIFVKDLSEKRQTDIQNAESTLKAYKEIFKKYK